MKTKILLMSVSLLGTTLHAANQFPSVPREIFCSSLTPNQPSLADASKADWIVSDADSDNVIRKSISARVIERYVDPAGKAACAKPRADGFEFIKDVESACQTGCTETLAEWNLRGQPRADMLEICRADCRAVKVSLTSFLASYLLLRRK